MTDDTNHSCRNDRATGVVDGELDPRGEVWKPQPGEELEEHGVPFGVILRVVDHGGCLELVVREYAGDGGELQIFGNVLPDGAE